MRHGPGKEDEWIPEFSPNSSFREIYRVQLPKVTIVKKIQVGLAPLQRGFYGGAPGRCKSDIQRNVKTMFRPVPNFSRQKPAGNRKEERLELPARNFFLRWKRKDTI